MNFSVGVRDGFTLVCLMICIWRVNRVPDPVLRRQPCSSWIKNVWWLSSLLALIYCHRQYFTHTGFKYLGNPKIFSVYSRLLIVISRRKVCNTSFLKLIPEIPRMALCLMGAKDSLPTYPCALETPYQAQQRRPWPPLPRASVDPSVPLVLRNHTNDYWLAQFPWKLWQQWLGPAK